MKYLFIKMRRDLAKMWTQFISVFLMAFLGVFIYVGMEGTWNGMQTEYNNYFTKTNLASAWVYGKGILDSDLQNIKKISGVENATLAMTLSVKVNTNNSEEEPEIQLTALADDSISKPYVMSGSKYTIDGDGIWLDNDFAKARNLKVGDNLTIKIDNIQKALKIKGLILSSEYIYYTGSNTSVVPNHKLHGYAMVSQKTAEDILNQLVATQMQKSAIPGLSKNLNNTYETATTKADEEAEKQFNAQVIEQKNQAYQSAVAKADSIVQQQFDKSIEQKKEQAYSEAVKKADVSATQAVNMKFKSAYPTLTDFSAIPSYGVALSSAKAQAEKEAKTQVTVSFEKQQSALQAQLKLKKEQAEQKARAEIDKQFEAKNDEFAQTLIQTKINAEKAARDLTTQQILQNKNLTSDQLDAINKLADIPKISDITDSAKKADTAKQFVSLAMSLPTFMLSGSINGVPLSTLKQAPMIYTEIRVKLKDNVDAQSLRNKAQDILDTRYMGYADRDSLTTISQPTQKTGQIKKMSILFSAIFLLLALLTMQTTMTRLVNTQSIQIGTLKAIGFRDGQIRLHYALYGLSIGLIGGILGLILAPTLISPILLHAQSATYTLPEWPVKITPVSYIVVLIVALCCTIATLFACRKGLKGMPAQTMRGTFYKTGGKVLLERASGLWKRISFGWKWSIRDISRNKVRSTMGIIGVLGCMMLLIASFGMQNSLDNAYHDVYAIEYTYGTKAVLFSTATQQNRDALEEITGKGQWVQETAIEYENNANDNTGILSVLGDGNYINLKDTQGIFVKPKKGVLVTQKTAQTLDLKKGGTIKFRLMGEKKFITSSVTDIIDVASPQGIFVSESEWKSYGKLFSPTALLIGSTSIKGKVKNLSYIKETSTLSDQYSSAKKGMNSFEIIFTLLKAAAILLGAVILYNLGILSFTERTREYATMKVLGFYQKEIRSFALRENLATAIVGWLIGIPIGLWFLKIYVGAICSNNFNPTPIITMLSFLLASLITICCSFGVSLFLSHKVKKIDMVESLKSIE